MRARIPTLAWTLLLGAAACGGPEGDASTFDPVVGGTLENLRNPEIGRFTTHTRGRCTATLITPSIAITAAHCVAYESSSTGGGQVTFRSRQGTTTARVSAFRSYSTRPGRADIALLKLDRAVDGRIASPRPLAARAPRNQEAVELWGYGCTVRQTRNSQGKTTLTVRYGRSQNLCKGDSGGPLLTTSGEIIGVNSAYNTVSGADIFALPSSLRSAIQAQVEAFGHSGSVFGTRSGNTTGGEAGALGASARVWRQTAGLRACGEWGKRENFSSGRYNAHRYRFTLSPGGTTTIELASAGGTYAPALVVARAGGEPLAAGRNRSLGVTLRSEREGRDGGPARVTLTAERAVSLDVYVTGWRAVQSDFQNRLSRSARYQLSMRQACGARPEPPPATAIRNLPFRTRGDTRTGRNVISRYGCAPSTNEGGPELVYTIEAPVAGVIAARLSNLPAGVDVDVHILVGDTCVSRGHWVASARVPAGRHRIIVDSWVDSAGRARAGAFDLEVGYTRPTDLTEAGLTAVAADRALTAFGEAFAQGATERLVYTIVDLDQPSDTPRLVTYDLLHQQVLVRTEAGHGAGSTVDGAPARVVSAGEGLQRSPVGLLLTAERSPDRIRLDGIEPTFNTDARARGLALAADPDAPRLTEGDLGVPPAALARIAEAVGDGSLVMVHFSDPTWTENSDYVAP